MSSTSNTSATILVVDDDDLILSALRGLFLLETEYEVLTHSDPKAALTEAHSRPIDIVISDFLMPEMNGVDFLGRLRETQPETVRILLTGFADKENAIRAINEVGLYQYIEKPWDNQDLLLIIRNALAERGLRRQLRDKVEEFNRLVRDHSDLSDRHRSLERELDMAARVQRSLLPDQLPHANGWHCAGAYHPSTAIGGDYYDFVARDDAHVVLLSDVSGHGAQAALTSMLIKAIFQDAAVEADSAEALLTQMNRRLHKFLPSGMFACATVLWILPGPTLTVTNAGLPYPYLVRRGAEKPEELPLSGMPLGMFPEALPNGYDSRTLDFEPGDLMIVASDGLGETRDQQGRFFQDEELAKALVETCGQDGDKFIECLMERSRAFRGDDNYDDDVSIITVARE
jgi:serine phosphatase RsbU (regulator of sigma subunit)